MNLLLSAAVCGAIIFVEQDLPGLTISSHRFPFAVPHPNARTAEVNRDGQTDLILAGSVRQQIAGKFPDSGRIPLPENARFDAVHIEGDLFFGYRGARVACYRLNNSAWSMFWEASVPDAIPANANPIFEDLDSDGKTELVLAVDTTLLVYRLDQGVERAGSLAIYPPARPEIPAAHDLWTTRDVPYPAPSLSRVFRVAFGGSSATIHETLSASMGLTDHRIHSYRIEAGPDGSLRATPDADPVTVQANSHMALCRLNDDNAPDFAGARVVDDTAGPWSHPLTDILLSTDGGVTTQVIRAKTLPAYLTAADFDGDGDMDILVESNDLYDRTPRELIVALTAERRITHSLYTHVQEVGGKFARSPRPLLRTTIRFDGPPIDGGHRWNAYRSGGLTSTGGDINGDGRADFVVWDSPVRISVHLNHEGLFESRPDATIPADDGFEWLSVADVDADGKMDIILFPPNNSRTPPKVYFSR